MNLPGNTHPGRREDCQVDGCGIAADPFIETLAREFYDVVEPNLRDHWPTWEHADPQSKAGYYDHAYAVREKLQPEAELGVTVCPECGEQRWAGTGPCRSCDESELGRLRRWKAEALPVLGGLHVLAADLEHPLGVRITGEAVAAALLRALVNDVARLRDANASVGWDDGPEQGAWLRVLADSFTKDSGLPATHHWRGSKGCRLPAGGATESPNCWCPRDAEMRQFGWLEDA